MCGIAGWFSDRPGQSSDRNVLQLMSRAIAHRGPDGRGMSVIDSARFAHVRLSVIDPVNGQQPMSTFSGQVSIVFNGEIYNYRELREHLRGGGSKFLTHSDTEVVAELYEKYGLASFSRLRGMFAIALWDNRSKTGYLVRDSMGIKPLFYAKDKESALYFGSEAKAIVAAKPQFSVLSEDVLHQVMNFRYVPGTASLFKEIHQLAPGEVVSWKNGSICFEKFTPEHSGEYQSLGEVLSGSVEKHMESDVPVGAYLSGGVDSAIVTALAKENSKEVIDTFTLEIGDDPLEAANAKQSAAFLGVNNISQAAKPFSDADFRALIWHLETPKVNALQVYQLADLAGDHVKVVLSGLGADEFFTGYNAHQIAHWLDKFRSMRLGLDKPFVWTRPLMEKCLNSANDPWSENYRAVALLSQAKNSPAAYALIRNIWDSPKLREKIYGPRLLDSQLLNCQDIIAQGMSGCSSHLEAILQFEKKEKLVNDLLWQEDRCGMAHGLEVRVPYVDVYVQSHLSGVGADQLMYKGQKKYLLKQYGRSQLPSEILDRRKSGFQVDAPMFFKAHLAPLAAQYLNPDALQKSGLFNPRFVQKTLKLPAARKYRWHFFMLYLMIGAQVWLELFEGSNHDGPR